jgi:hypothetical protein
MRRAILDYERGDEDPTPLFCGGYTVNRKGEVVMAYDPKSYELAEHFLKDHPTESETEYKLLCDALAIVIQDAIELWFTSQETEQQGKGTEPGPPIDERPVDPDAPPGAAWMDKPKDS